MRRVWIPGEPVPKARARCTCVGGTPRLYNTQKVKEFESRVRRHARQVFREPLSGPLAVSLRFWYPMSGQPLKTRERPARPYQGRHDVDNLCKSTLDGMNRVAYEDDKQIYRLVAEAWHCSQSNNEPGIEVLIWPWNGRTRGPEIEL